MNLEGVLRIWAPAIADHLWQSTLFAVIAGLLTLALRRSRARVRYWVWFSASLKFLIPFSLLVAAGSQFGWRSTPGGAQPAVTAVIQEFSQPFTPSNVPPMPSFAANPGMSWPIAIAGLWACGCIGLILSSFVQFRRAATMAKRATVLTSGREFEALCKVQQLSGAHQRVELRVSDGRLEPGVFGIFRNILLLPAGITDRLDQAQLEAIAAHELSHVRRRDNLFAGLHTVVEAIFWFHPLVWWLGARQMDERERDCDEEVLRLGSEPHTYAESILQVCKFYLESPTACVAGVTGSNLKKRIAAIMAHQVSPGLDGMRKILLAGFAVAAVALPVIIGLVNAPASHAQQPDSTTPSEFDTVSIKPSNPNVQGGEFQMLPGGRLFASNVTIPMLIERAYRVKRNQITGGPGWMNSARFDIQAKTDAEAGSVAKIRPMIAKMLEQRFKLSAHRETREQPVYALLVAKGGLKIEESKAGTPSGIHSSRTLIEGDMTMADLAAELTTPLGREVVDATDLKGRYKLRLLWSPEDAAASDSTVPTLFTSLQEQLGLRVESRKGPVEIIVVDRVEKPSEN